MQRRARGQCWLPAAPSAPGTSVQGFGSPLSPPRRDFGEPAALSLTHHAVPALPPVPLGKKTLRPPAEAPGLMAWMSEHELCASLHGQLARKPVPQLAVCMETSLFRDSTAGEMEQHSQLSKDLFLREASFAMCVRGGVAFV